MKPMIKGNYLSVRRPTKVPSKISMTSSDMAGAGVYGLGFKVEGRGA